MQIKPTLNVKITLNVNCKCQGNKEKCPAQHCLFLSVLSENCIILNSKS